MEYLFFVIGSLLANAFTEANVTKLLPSLVPIQGSECIYWLDDRSGIVLGFSPLFPHELTNVTQRRKDEMTARRLPLHGEWVCHSVLFCYSRKNPVLLTRQRVQFSRFNTLQFEDPCLIRFLCRYSSWYDLIYTVSLEFIDEKDDADVRSGKAIDPGILRQVFFSVGDLAIGWHPVDRSPFGCLMIATRSTR